MRGRSAVTSGFHWQPGAERRQSVHAPHSPLGCGGQTRAGRSWRQLEARILRIAPPERAKVGMVGFEGLSRASSRFHLQAGHPRSASWREQIKGLAGYRIARPPGFPERLAIPAMNGEISRHCPGIQSRVEHRILPTFGCSTGWTQKPLGSSLTQRIEHWNASRVSGWHQSGGQPLPKTGLPTDLHGAMSGDVWFDSVRCLVAARTGLRTYAGVATGPNSI